MGKQLALPTAGLAPAPIPADLDLDLRVCTNKLEAQGLGFVWARDFRLPAVWKARLEQRARYLADVLKPIGPTGAAAQLAILRSSGLKSAPMPDGEAGHAAMNIIRTLQVLPPYALALAVAEFVDGRQGDGWVPAIPMLRKRAEHHAGPATAELSRITRVLSAKHREPRDPAKVKANLAEAEALKAEMQGVR